MKTIRYRDPVGRRRGLIYEGALSAASCIGLHAVDETRLGITLAATEFSELHFGFGHRCDFAIGVGGVANLRRFDRHAIARGVDTAAT